MINFIFYRNSKGFYKGFEVSGHAGYAKRGKDIVCAAVSVLSINTVNSIESYTKEKFNCTYDDFGSIKFEFEADVDSLADSDGQLLIKSLALGMISIHEEYGDKHVQLYFKEV